MESNNEVPAIDNEKDPDRKTRRSSILKQHHSRNALTSVESETNPDNTQNRASRRVSFASSNFVKPFAADPEKNTIWDNTYEEELNQTDSIKCSEGTQDNKCLVVAGLLNTTLISSDSDGEEEFRVKKSSFKIWDSTYMSTDAPECEKENFRPPLKFFSEEAVIKTKKVARRQGEENMIIRSHNSRQNNNLDLQTDFSHQLQCDMELTGNHKEAFCEITSANNAYEVPGPFKEKTVIFNETDYMDIDTTVPNCAAGFSTKPMFKTDGSLTADDSFEIRKKSLTTNLEESQMELTKPLPVLTIISQNPEICANQTLLDNIEETIYPEEDMLITQAMPTSNEIFVNTVGLKQRNILTSESILNKTVEDFDGHTDNFRQLGDEMEITVGATALSEKSQNCRKTMYFNNSENDMVLTQVLPTPQKVYKNIETSKIPAVMDKNILPKNTLPEEFKDHDKTQTMNFCQSEGNMEITGPLLMPMEVSENIESFSEKICHKSDQDSDKSAASVPRNILRSEINKRKTINFNQSEADMEITGILPTVRDISKNSEIHFNNSEENKLCTQPLATSKVGADVLASWKTGSDTLPICKKQANVKTVNCNNEKTDILPSALPTAERISKYQKFPESEPSDSENILQSKNALRLKERVNSPEIIETTLPNHDSSKNIKTTVYLNQSSAALLPEDNFKCITAERRDNNINETDNNLDKVSISFQTLNSNILYTEPRKMKLNPKNLVPVPENLKVQTTPSASFAINVSNIIPCIEDTQQLLLEGGLYEKNKEKITEGTFEKSNVISFKKRSKLLTNSSTSKGLKRDESQVDTIASDDEGETIDVVGVEIEKQAFGNMMASQSHVYGIDEECAESVLCPSPDTGDKNTSDGHNVIGESQHADDSSCSPDYHNYTSRSYKLLVNIQKHLVPWKPIDDESEKRCDKICERFVEVNHSIKHLIENFKLPEVALIDLEEMYKDEDSSANSGSEAVLMAEEEKNDPSLSGLLIPKSLKERVAEAVKRSEKFIEFIKSDNDYFYFYTLFGCIVLKINVHPALGIVYKVETSRHLKENPDPIFMYEVAVLELKLKEENLLSALGNKYDILTLLDYVCLSMEDIIDFYMGYLKVKEKYGSSHKFVMHSDFSITFEILNVSLVIWWIISIKMSLITVGAKEGISVTYKLRKKVKEEDIKSIAENSPAGPNFLETFIESIDEYVQKIGKKRMQFRDTHFKSLG